jgi:hypothetical protein
MLGNPLSSIPLSLKDLRPNQKCSSRGWHNFPVFSRYEPLRKVIKQKDFKSCRTHTYGAPVCNSPVIKTIQIARGVWGSRLHSNLIRSFKNRLRFHTYVTIHLDRMPALGEWLSAGPSFGLRPCRRGAFADKSLGERLPVRGAFADKEVLVS